MHNSSAGNANDWKVEEFHNDAMSTAKEPPPPPWRTSNAKARLKNDIINKVITKETPFDEVCAMHAEYSKYRKDRFKTNLKNLFQAIDRINESKDEQSTDPKNSKRKKNNKKKDQPVPWRISRAKEILKNDIINQEVALGMLEAFGFHTDVANNGVEAL